MYCMQCGKENVSNARFCEHCGASMSAGGQSVIESLQARTSGVFASAVEPLAIAASFYIGLSGFVYWLVGVLLWLVAAGAGFIGAMDIPREFMGKAAQAEAAAAWLTFFAIAAQIFGVFLLSCAYGLWNHRAWGRQLGLVLMILSVVFTFLGLGAYERVTGPVFIVTALSAFVDVLIIFWLVHPATKEAFNKTG